MEGVENAQVPSWRFGNFMTYIKVAPNTNITDLEGKLVDIIKAYKDPNYEENKKAKKHFWYVLQPV